MALSTQSLFGACINEFNKSVHLVYTQDLEIRKMVANKRTLCVDPWSTIFTAQMRNFKSLILNY